MTCRACLAGGTAPCPACRAAAPGSLFADRYRVQRLLGEGARKRVLLAVDTWLERPVAVCLLPGGGSEDLGLLRRESTVTAQLSGSDRVVAVYDVGEADGLPYLTAQYLPGGSLGDRLAQGPLGVPRALSVAQDVALALAEVHARGLVHRDVKPANVWLTVEERAVLGDFGLARHIGEPLEIEDVLSGTAAYLPPEQLDGGPAAPSGDLYSLGVLLWELLCGRPLFVAPDVPTLLDKQLHAVPDPPSLHRPGLPEAVDALVLRLLSRTPQDRPRSAATVAEQLRALRAAVLAARPSTVGSTALVGRGEELDVLRQHLASAVAGGGGLALVLGQAGMGKTRLVRELAQQAPHDEVLVLEGRCHDGEGAPAYWPWTQVLRALHDALGLEALRTAADSSTALLGALLPELDDGGAAPDSEGARFRLFDAVARLLQAVAAHRPLLVVLDDVHAADLPTLALARYVTAETRGRRIALVLCARELSGPDPATSAALGRLGAAASRTVVLDGLPLDQASRLVEQLAGVGPSPALMQTLHGRSDGNPFFLAELVRLLVAEHRLAPDGTLLPGPSGVPTGVLEVLHRRLELVSPACTCVLRVASVIGREAPFDLLQRITAVPAEELLARLDEATSARLLIALPGVPVTYRFAHALVQEALHDALPATERVALHRAVALALASLSGGALDERAAELAHHFVEAVPGGDPVPAVRWSVRAAHQALACSAYEEAVAHFQRALALAQACPPADVLPRVGDLLLALGDAQCRAGLTDQGRTTFQHAADLALADGDPELLAYAALGYGVGLGGFGFVEHADGVLLSLIEEALATLPPADSPLRVRLLARLATELYFTPFRSRRRQVADEALAMSRRLGEPAGELLALYSSTWALHGPDDAAQRARTADELVRLAHRLGDHDMAFRAHHLRLNVQLESGAWQQALADIEGCRLLSARLAQPLHHWQVAAFDAMRLLVTGRADEGAEAAEEALALGRRGHGQMATVVYGAQLLAARWAQGRLEEVLDAARVFADRYPYAPAWRAALAFCCTEVGDHDSARVELDALALRDFEDLPRDGNFLTAACLLAQTAARVGDLPRAALLQRMLQPYADRYVVMAAGAVAFVSVELPLAALASALGEPERALAHVVRARQKHQSRGARCLSVWTAEEHARILRERGAPGDREAAAAVTAQALVLAEELGMPRHARRLADADPGAAAGAQGAGAMTVLITDVCGSTALTERLGEVAVHALLSAHREHAEQTARTYGGAALKSLGDGVLLAFADAACAVRCATQVQEAAVAQGLSLRLGMHTGPVLRQGESLYGRTMILAFRIADRARAGEVLVSTATRDALRELGHLRFDRGRRVRLKGFTEPQLVHRLLWQVDAAAGPGRTACVG